MNNCERLPRLRLAMTKGEREGLPRLWLAMTKEEREGLLRFARNDGGQGVL